MQWNRFWQWIAPRAAEQDPEFRGEIERISQRALYIIGAVQFGMPLVGLGLAFLFHSHMLSQTFHPWHPLSFFLLGALSIAGARIGGPSRYSRPTAYLIGLATAILMVMQHPPQVGGPPTDELLLVINITIVLLVATAIVPGWPLHMLLLGAAVSASYFGLLTILHGWQQMTGMLLASHAVHFLPAATILCAALAGANYQRLHAAYRTYQEAMRVQSRLLLAETAASMGHFAAGLSHELNNASSALKSAIETLELIAARKGNATGPARAKLETTEAELRLASRQSVERLHDIVQTMQRFVNLDRAETLAIDLNALLNDVVSLAAPRIPEGVEVQTRLLALPEVVLRPQQISAVFSQLLHNALDDTGASGRILLETKHVNAHVEVSVRDSGSGLSQAELAAVFEPGFRVSGTRVRSARWDLFISRQIIQEHGGEIRVESASGDGTTVRVTLPC